MATKSRSSAPASAPAAEELLDRFLAHKEQGKLHYAQADAALGEIVELLRPIRGKKLLTAAGGEVYELVDNFADTNVGWGHGSVRRFDLKLLKARKPAAAIV